MFDFKLHSNNDGHKLQVIVTKCPLPDQCPPLGKYLLKSWDNYDTNLFLGNYCVSWSRFSSQISSKFELFEIYLEIWKFQKILQKSKFKYISIDEVSVQTDSINIDFWYMCFVWGHTMNALQWVIDLIPNLGSSAPKHVLKGLSLQKNCRCNRKYVYSRHRQLGEGLTYHTMPFT